MPTVPTYEPGQVGFAGGMNGRVDVRPLAGAFGIDPAAVGSVGADLQQASDQRRVQDARWDETVAKDALSRYSPQERLSLFGTPDAPGVLSLSGKDALNARQSAEDQLSKAKTDTVALGQNDRQKRLIADQIQLRQDHALERIATHSATQGQVYEQAMTSAAMDTSAQEAVTYADDPIEQHVRIEAGLGQLRNQLRSQGLEDPTVYASKALAYTSGIHKAVASDLLTSDPNKAQAYFDAHKSDMTFADRDGLWKQIYPATIEAADAKDARDFFGGLGGAGVTKPGDLTPAQIAQESGGKADAVSPKGALGIMQLMPATAREQASRMGLFDVAGLSSADLKARLLGDPALNTKLGVGYRNFLSNRYDGNAVLTLAAYNAGPGAVDSWLQKYGDPRDGSVSSQQWADRIPYAETKNYVSSVLAKVGGVATTTSQPTLEQGLAYVRSKYADDPVRLASAEKAIIAESGKRDAIANDHKEAAWDAFQPTQQAVNAGQVTSRAQVVNTPQFRALSPERQTQVLKDVDTAAAKAQAEAASQAHVAAALGGGLPLDPKNEADKKAADTTFTAQSAQWGPPGSAKWLGMATDFASRIGVTPGPMLSYMRAALRSDQPGTVGAAVNMYATLKQKNPRLLNELDGSDVTLAEGLASRLSAGLTLGDSYKQTTNLARLPKAEVEASTAAYTALAKAQPDANFLSARTDKDHGTGFLIFHSTPAVTAQMTAQFTQAAQDAYALNGGDINAAREAAYQQLTRTWGPSRIMGGGGEQMRRWAPETVFGVFGDQRDSKWQAEQLQHEIPPSMGLGSKGLSVEVNPSRPFDAQGRPIYAVNHVDEHGIPHPVYLPSGEQMLWQPDYASSPEGKRQGGKQREVVAQAHAEWERRRSGRAAAVDTSLAAGNAMN